MAGQNVVDILVKATNQTGAGFGEAKAGADETAASMEELAAAETEANAAEAELGEKLTAMTAVLDDQNATAEAAAKVQADYAAAQDRSAAAATRLQAAVERNAAAQDEATVATKAGGDAAEESAAKTDTAGGVMAGAGGKVKLAALGVAVGMGLAVKSAMDFQQTSTKWVTSAGESAAQLGMLQQGVLALSAQTATSSTELSNGLYTISSAGITGASGLNVLKAAAEGAKSEGADLATVTNALTSGINAYGMNVKTSAAATTSATSMMNQMLATVSAGKMTFQELAGSLSSVLPIAAANKISYAQVGGALATMTSMGVSAQQGTQDLAFSIRSLANPTSVATNEMAMFGINSTTVASQLGKKGLSGTISELSSAVLAKMGPAGTVIVNSMNQSKAAAADATTMLGMLPKSIQGVAKAYLDGSASYTTFNNTLKAGGLQAREMGLQFASVAGKAHGFNQLLASGSPAAQTYAAAMSKMLGGATGLNVGLMLTGQHAATFDKNVQSIASHANGASGQVSGFSDVTKETSFQMAKAADSLKAAGTELGMTLLPAVNAILKPLASFLGMIAQNKVAAIAFATVVGGLLAGAVGTKAVHALTDMREAMKTVASGVEAAIGKIKGLVSANDEAAVSSGKAAGAAETAAGEEEAAAGEAAAAAEGAAEETAAANEEAAAESSASWLASLGGQLAAAAAWVAESVAKVAVVVAANIAGALSTAAAWVAANAVMLLGIGAVVAIVALAVYEIVKHWKSIVHGVEEAWDAVYHAVSEAVSKVVGFVKSHWELLLAILTGPIGLAVLEIAKHWDTIKKDASKFAADVVSTVSRLAGDVLHWFGHMVTSVVSTVARWYGDLTDWVRRVFDDFIALETRGIGNIIHWFAGLPGRIMGAIASLPGQLFSAGKNIIHMLAQGISSAIGDVTGAIGSVGSEILSHLPFSPAKKGPLSGSGSPDRSGRKIAQMVAQGLTAGTPDVQAAMERLAGSAGLSGRALAPAGGYGAYAAGGRQQLDITLTMGSNALLKAMQAEVRTAGGDPSMFQRKVAYR